MRMCCSGRVAEWQSPIRSIAKSGRAVTVLAVPLLLRQPPLEVKQFIPGHCSLLDLIVETVNKCDSFAVIWKAVEIVLGLTISHRGIHVVTCSHNWFGIHYSNLNTKCLASSIQSLFKMLWFTVGVKIDFIISFKYAVFCVRLILV